MANGIYIVQGEANAVVALLKRYRKNSSRNAMLDEYDPLLRGFADLRDVLKITDVSDMNYTSFLSPFLDVIRSEATDELVTARALAAIEKFINYGLMSPASIKVGNAVNSIAQSVIKAKFVETTDSGSECVVFQILQTLKALLLSPCGNFLTNETVCEVLQCCFRIGLEASHEYPELLRTAAEGRTKNVQLLFTRLPTFGREDMRHPYIRRLLMKGRGEGGSSGKRRKKKTPIGSSEETAYAEAKPPVGAMDLPKTPATSLQNNELDEGNLPDTENSSSTDTENPHRPLCKPSSQRPQEEKVAAESPTSLQPQTPIPIESASQLDAEHTVSSNSNEVSTTTGVKSNLQDIAYGLPAVRELLRFLIAIANPLDRSNNPAMNLLGLNLLTVAMEAGADYFESYPLLLPLVKNELCRALLQHLNSDKFQLFDAANRVCFLLFESLRTHLKFQLEAYFLKLKKIITDDQPKASYELKEMALESLIGLWRIPGLVTELYLNYDCGLYCSNLFEELTKLLSTNAFPVGGLRSIHILSLDALLTVVDTIERNCATKQAGALSASPLHAAGQQASALPGPGEVACCLGEWQRPMKVSPDLPSISEVIDSKKQKRLLTEGSDLFNFKPNAGIEFLTEKGMLKSPIDPGNVAHWLRTNPRLDKTKIADYICDRRNAEVLRAFVFSFPFEETRLDEALRLFLETFRLPGESAEIGKIMTHFAEHWSQANNNPFNHVDAAFTMAYAIIMLNTDQHNPQVRRNQVPMTLECFKRNLSGTNNGENFDDEMLEKIYMAIKNEEIVMPAEQVGLVKENYLWKMLLRRGETKEGTLLHAPAGWNDHDLFAIIWSPTIAALSYVFDKSIEVSILTKAINGYRKCATIAAYYGMTNVFDNLIIHLCKFSSLMQETRVSNHPLDDSEGGHDEKAAYQQSPEALAMSFAENAKAQQAARAMFYLVHAHGDNLREGWKNVLDCLLHLYRARLAPSRLVQVEDFLDSSGYIHIQKDVKRPIVQSKNDSGILSWFGFSTNDPAHNRRNSEEREKLLKQAQALIAECRPEQLLSDGKYLTSSSLVELVNSIAHASLRVYSPAAAESGLSEGNIEGIPSIPERAKLSRSSECEMVFLLELMISIVLENKDRLMQVWPTLSRHLRFLLSKHFGRHHFIVERAVVGILRIANRNLFRLNDENAFGQEVLCSLALLLRLRPPALSLFSRQIAFGLHCILHNNAANIHRKDHWLVFFSLMEAVGAAAYPEAETNSEEFMHVDPRQIQSDDGMAHAEYPLGVEREERGYLSDSLQRRREPIKNPLLEEKASSLVSLGSNNGEWIHVVPRPSQEGTQFAHALPKPFDRGTLVTAPNIARHDPMAFLKVSETLGFLARDAAHITPENFQSCARCLCIMIEASMDGGRNSTGLLVNPAQEAAEVNKPTIKMQSEKKTKAKASGHRTPAQQPEEHAHENANENEPNLSTNYEIASLQLLAIASNLSAKAPTIYKNWAMAGGGDGHCDWSLVWNDCWKQCMLGMARLATDCRRKIRAHSLDCLGAALRLPELSGMSPADWEDCFASVIFPLLRRLLTNISPMDPIGMEEIRVRAIQLLFKTVLFRIMELSRMASFSAFFDALLELMEQYLRCEGNDILLEAIPEQLKNMMLVCDSSNIFVPTLRESLVTKLTGFLPNLATEIAAVTSASASHPSQVAVGSIHGSGFTPLAELRPAPTTNFQIVQPVEPRSAPEEPPPLQSSDCYEEGAAAAKAHSRQQINGQPSGAEDTDELIAVIVDRR